MDTRLLYEFTIPGTSSLFFAAMVFFRAKTKGRGLGKGKGGKQGKGLTTTAARGFFFSNSGVFVLVGTRWIGFSLVFYPNAMLGIAFSCMYLARCTL